MSDRRLLAVWAVAASCIGAAPASVAALPAGCPQKVCACLGEARRFDLTASNTLRLRAHEFSFGYGSSYVIAPFTQSSVCTQTGSFSGSSYGTPDIGEDLILAAPTGTALKVRGRAIPGSDPSLLHVDRDLATGGGGIQADPGAIEVGGVIDTTGTHPRIGSCQQALVDATAVSAELAALPPTQVLGNVVAANGYVPVTHIYAGPGVNVIDATSITVRPMKTYGHYYEGSEIVINLEPDTEAVIINTGRLSVGAGCLISVFGSRTRVLINVVRSGPVKINHDVNIEAPILAPQSNVNVRFRTYIANVFGAKVTLRGSGTNGLEYPSCSPSGAFLDGAD
jgi:hypothetical protein